MNTANINLAVLLNMVGDGSPQKLKHPAITVYDLHHIQILYIFFMIQLSKGSEFRRTSIDLSRQVLGDGLMKDVKYICPGCGFESAAAGSCPECQRMLVATCSECGNPLVGEQVSAED